MADSLPEPVSNWLARFGDYDAALAGGERLFHVGLSRGSMTVELYRPLGADLQKIGRAHV